MKEVQVFGVYKVTETKDGREYEKLKDVFIKRHNLLAVKSRIRRPFIILPIGVAR